VRYRSGGRESRQLYAGSFKTRELAEIRRAAVLARLAAGEDPRAWDTGDQSASARNPVFPIVWLTERLARHQANEMGETLPHIEVIRDRVREVADVAETEIARNPGVFG
jgi:hypothetical protein